MTASHSVGQTLVGWMAANQDTADDMRERSSQQALPFPALATGQPQESPPVEPTTSWCGEQGAPPPRRKAAGRPGNSGSVFSPSAWTSLVVLGLWEMLGLLVVAGLVTGCTGVSSAPPPLADSTFARVLTDLHLAQSRHRTLANQLDAPPPPRDSIFAHHSIRATAFEATLRHYSRHPGALAGIYQSVIDTLTARQQAARRAVRAASRDSAPPAAAPPP